MSLKGRNLLDMSDLAPAEVRQILELAAKLKRERKTGGNQPLLAGRTLGLLFALPSLRTRVSFEVAMAQLGGSSTYLAWDEVGVGRRESLIDVARNLSRWVDCIAVRTVDHAAIEQIAANSSVPVINGLSSRSHPCQALADLFTIEEHCGRVKGLNVLYVGDGNNVAQSLLLAASMAGADTVIATPPDYAPDPVDVDRAESYAAESGGSVTLTGDLYGVVGDADIIYTDVWVSMGQEAEQAERRIAFREYQINSNLMSRAKPGAKVMHCQPAHRDEEITSEVLDSPASIALDQAENRLHVQKAVLASLV